MSAPGSARSSRRLEDTSRLRRETCARAGARGFHGEPPFRLWKLQTNQVFLVLLGLAGNRKGKSSFWREGPNFKNNRREPLLKRKPHFCVFSFCLFLYIFFKSKKNRKNRRHSVFRRLQKEPVPFCLSFWVSNRPKWLKWRLRPVATWTKTCGPIHSDHHTQTKLGHSRFPLTPPARWAGPPVAPLGAKGETGRYVGSVAFFGG